MKIPANNQVFFIKNVVAVAAYRSCRLWRWVKMSWIHDVLCDHHWTQCRHALSNTGHVAQVRVLENSRRPPKSPDTAKLTGPRSSTDEKVGGPVKNMGGPIKLLYVIMFNILKSCQKWIFGPVKLEKFSRCLKAADRMSGKATWQLYAHEADSARTSWAVTRSYWRSAWV